VYIKHDKWCLREIAVGATGAKVGRHLKWRSLEFNYPSFKMDDIIIKSKIFQLLQVAMSGHEAWLFEKKLIYLNKGRPKLVA
jgi:hypothetical protein